MIWSKLDIRKARKVPLVPVLSQLGYTMRKLEYDNYLVEDHGSVIVRDNYWFCKDDLSAGNAIDFFVIVEGWTFSEAMALLVGNKKKKKTVNTNTIRL